MARCWLTQQRRESSHSSSAQGGRIDAFLETHDPDALFGIIAKQQRGQAVIEADDAERRQTAKRRDARSVAAARTKPQGNAADEHDSRESAKAAGVKAERNRRYDNNECFICGKQ